MKNCPNCGSQMDDAAAFCTNCGSPFAPPAPPVQPAEPAQQPPYSATQQPQPPQAAYAAAPVFDPYDHTAEFDPKDISDNKVFAMISYLLGTMGIIIALLASHSSAYTMFHVRQALKFSVVTILMAICTCLLFWTILVPIACGIMLAILEVIRIICFFQICSGKAKEPAIIRNLSFLK